MFENLHPLILKGSKKRFFLSMGVLGVSVRRGNTDHCVIHQNEVLKLISEYRNPCCKDEEGPKHCSEETESGIDFCFRIVHTLQWHGRQSRENMDHWNCHWWKPLGKAALDFVVGWLSKPFHFALAVEVIFGWQFCNLPLTSSTTVTVKSIYLKANLYRLSPMAGLPLPRTPIFIISVLWVWLSNEILNPSTSYRL